MAVYSTVVASVTTAAATTTLTGWAPYVAITVPAAAANGVYASTDGTAVVTGVDSILCPAGATTYLRNRTEAPELTATIPGAFDPSAIAAQTHNGSPVSLVASATTATITVALVTSPGVQPVIG
ncbi:MAG TPA: hypothetical protein VGF75_06690 [Candidatus Saccharimonadales bacterium]